MIVSTQRAAVSNIFRWNTSLPSGRPNTSCTAPAPNDAAPSI